MPCETPRGMILFVAKGKDNIRTGLEVRIHALSTKCKMFVQAFFFVLGLPRQ